MLERSLLVLIATCSCLSLLVLADDPGASVGTSADARDGTTVAALYGANVSLSCDSNGINLTSGYHFLYWILPDLTVLNVTDDVRFLTYDGVAGWTVDGDGELLLFHVADRHFGFYHCHALRSASGDVRVARFGVNVNGAYFGDLWPKYRKQTYIAIGCSLAALLATTVGCYFLGGLSVDDDGDDDDDEAVLSKENLARQGNLSEADRTESRDAGQCIDGDLMFAKL